MGLIVVCAIAGGICAMIAAGKGRDALGWFVIGFFLPVIGIVLALVLDPLNTAGKTTPAQALHTLKQLSELRASNAITQAEYEQKKQELLTRV